MRLIDLDELLKFPIRLDHYDKENGDEHFAYGVEAVLEYAENLPVVESEPVRHGRWLVKMLDIGGGDKIRLLQCSECSRNANMKFDFCPNCGALMDGGADNG